MIEILPEHRWSELESVFDREFDAALPNKDKATILAGLDENGQVEAFIVAETLVRIGQVYVSDKGKGKNYPFSFIRYLLGNIGTHTSVIVIASDERFESLCEKLKMRSVEGSVFRRDF